MNAHNKENDPFEDVFKDRFADFESEPDTQLWQKIEPKLPVDSTRKFPYWQTSAVAMLLLAGLWIYREDYLGDVVTDSDDSQTKNIVKLGGNQIKNKMSSDSRLTESNPTQNTNGKDLIVNDLAINTTKNVSIKSDDKMDIDKLPNRSLQDDNEASVRRKEGKYITEIDENKKSSLFSNPNTTIETSTTSFSKTTDNNFSENNKNQLNLIPVNNSNEKQEISIKNSSNNLSIPSVFSNKENVSVLSKNSLITLDSKNYSLLRNHFKTPKLKFVIAPKKDDYFKERKPLEMYASVMPLLNYYTITPNGNDANYVHSIAVNNDEDRLGFYTQAGLVFTLSDRFKLRTGLTFTRTNHSINYQIRTDSLIIQPSDRQGVDVSFEEKKANYSQVANYLGTKIEVQYIFLEGESLTHYLNVGLEGAYRLNGVKQFNGFANFAYGVTRQIGDNAYLFVEPTFSYSLNQQSDNNSFLLVKPNKIGFNIGVNFKIK
jgi:hypothetical protein